MDATPSEVKQEVVDAIASAYTTNRGHIAQKIDAIGDGLLLLLAESLALTLGLALG
jgi:hypothetical protein